MTRTNYFKKIKSKLCIMLALALVFTCSLVLFTACKDEQATVTDPSYTYTEQDKGSLITNSSFSLNVTDNALTSFPVTSPTGWTRSTDSSTTSQVNSGVINTSEAGFKELLNTLSNDTDFINYIKYYNETAINEAVKTEKGDANYVPTASDITDYIKANEDKFFKNPGKYAESADDFVYMLNNIPKNNDLGFGTAQKVVSSSSVTIKAGKTYKLSVWIKTDIDAPNNAKPDYANIRLTNSLKGNSQSEYRINGIKNTEWEQFEIYVTADKFFDSTISLVLGLGYGDTGVNAGIYFNQGTVYFDDVKVEEFTDAIPAEAIANSQTLVYGSEDKLVADGETNRKFVYDMSLEKTITGLQDISFAGLTFADQSNPDYYYYTASNTTEGGAKITSQTIYPQSVATPKVENNTLSVELKNASYTVKIDDNGSDFQVNEQEFKLISITLDNSLLSKFNSTDISVNVIETSNGGKIYPAVATFNQISDEVTVCEIIVKNNFDLGLGAKTFYLEVVLGPSNVKAVEYASDFACGTVTLSGLESFTGKINEDDYANETDYKFYSLLSSSADATVSLFAGYTADYTETTNSESYSITAAPGSFGEILSKPTAPMNYFGITSNHIYLKEEASGLDTAVNDRNDLASTNGYAGLINTKYLSAYGDATLTALLDGDYTADKNIQPIVINNKVADHYGYISTAKNVSASSFASVSVTLKVDATAAAYLYLVNVASVDKEVIAFPAIGEDATERKLQTVITDTNGEWVTFSFYLATGANKQDFRVEIWNGGRDGADATASTGYVIIKDITVNTSSWGSYSEATSTSTAFSASGNPLYQKKYDFTSEGTELIAYTRALTDTEKEFNKEYPDKAVSYEEKYVWGKSATMVYAVLNTLDPVASNPYDNIEDEGNDEGSGCSASTDPSSFWLSFASILLAVILVFAILALIFKNIRRRRKANKSDAKSHYKVKSRIATNNENKKRKAKAAKAEDEDAQEEVEEEVQEENAEEVVEEAEATEAETEEAPAETEQNLDEYVYGDVQDFGDAETNEEPKDDQE